MARSLSVHVARLVLIGLFVSQATMLWSTHCFAEAETEKKKPQAPAGFVDELKRNCSRHFPGQIQAEVRTACASAATSFHRHGKFGSQTRCRLDYGEEPRDVMACLVGVDIAQDLDGKKEDFKRKHQLCAEQYPAYTEVDVFLQESCLTGVHLPALMENKVQLEMCSQVTPERSFLGPCVTGLSLSQSLDSPATPPVQPSSQNKLCEQYFDHRQLHTGYRACLNARGLAINWTDRATDLIKNCGNLASEPNSDTERAACVVGASIYKHLLNKGDVAKRFQKCGDNKVSYQDRDFLACLTAASLLDFTDKNGADAGCREVFKTAKSKGRGDCVNSISLF